LRTVTELFPEIIQPDPDRDDLPSCSALEALDRQEPFVNPTLANHALALLARLFRYGTVSYPGHSGISRVSAESSHYVSIQSAGGVCAENPGSSFEYNDQIVREVRDPGARLINAQAPKLGSSA
jgi:hypothetical protein